MRSVFALYGAVLVFSSFFVGMVRSNFTCAAGLYSLNSECTPAPIGFYAQNNVTIECDLSLQLGAAVCETASIFTSLFAGGNPTATSADGIGTHVYFKNPTGVATDSRGNVFVTDMSAFDVRKINSAGVVTTYAGLFNTQGTADGTGTVARFKAPKVSAADTSGNLFVSDTTAFNIRKITTSRVTSIAYGVFTAFNGLCIATNGLVYVVDGNVVEVVDITAATQTTLAGVSNAGNFDGLGTNARFFNPAAIAIDSVGVLLYVADQNAHTIRTVTTNGLVTTFAGISVHSGFVDGDLTSAQFNSPSGITLDTNGIIYIADGLNYAIRMISAGVVTTIAGNVNNSAINGFGTTATFNSLGTLTITTDGKIYVADTANQMVRLVDQAGPCADGFYYNTSTASSCVATPAGYYKPRVSYSATYYICSPGFYSPSGSTACSSCAYSFAYGQTACNPPTAAPTTAPTVHPSAMPTPKPSSIPSVPPSSKPSTIPTPAPTAAPTSEPSTKPSTLPTASPTSAPTSEPSTKPSTLPTPAPTASPTSEPSTKPSTLPTPAPTASPTSEPSAMPSALPTPSPTSRPTSLPSAMPSTPPTEGPSAPPTSLPSAVPSTPPTVVPSTPPTALPSAMPSTPPTAEPSTKPSTTPTSEPTSNPSVFPSAKPSTFPSTFPSAKPSTTPTTEPTAKPSTAKPTGVPSRVPSPYPTARPTINYNPTLVPTPKSGQLGFDIGRPNKLTQAEASCLAANNVKFGFVRGYQTWNISGTSSDSVVDTNVCRNARAINKYNMDVRGFFVQPKPRYMRGLTATSPFRALKATLLRECSSFQNLPVYISVVPNQFEDEGWFNSHARNRAYMLDLATSCRDYFTYCGVQASQDSWTSLFGESGWYNYSTFNGFNLWYQGNEHTSFRDWFDGTVSIGAFSTHYVKAKQIMHQSTLLCGTTHIGLDYMLEE